MKRKLIAFSMTMALLISVFSAAIVGAHTVTIEHPTLAASRADWFGVQPDTSQGIIQRNASQQGEFVFNDPSKDQRLITAGVDITREVDLDWFSVTADPTNIYFLAKVDKYCCVSNNPSLELIITIDTNQGNNQGTVDLPFGSGTFSTTQVKSEAAWEFAVRTTFPSGSSGTGAVNGTTRIHTTAAGAGSTCASCSSQVASQGNFAEIKVPWTQIGGKPTGAKFLRFTVSTAYDNHVQPSPSDGYNSPVMDVLSAPGAGTTLADLQDGVIDTSFDVHFDTNGTAPTYEPYAPLLVTEFQANPIGNDSPGPTNTSTHTEWIEVYNPNSFALTLSDYKIGNAAKRGSSTQGMFKFKASSIPAKGLVIVAREKSRFLAGHPGFPTATVPVYDLTNDMTKYNAWSTGDLQLANQPSPPATTFEEQVLILDAKDDVVDMATYGNPTAPYPGHTPLSTAFVPEGVSYERCPVTRDTNNSNVDFAIHGSLGEQTPGVTCDGVPGLDLTLVKDGPINPSKDIGTGVRTANFTLTYSNIGTVGENAAVTIVDTLPAGLTFSSAEGAPVVTGQTVTWTLPTGLPAGANGTFVLTATVDSGVGENVPLINTATINSPTEQSAAKGNNSSSWTVTTLGPPDTNISSNLEGPLPPGAEFEFTITYQNTGQDDATDLTITDILPQGVTILSVDSPGATWDGATTGTVTWDVGTLGPNEGGTILIKAKLDPAAQAGSTVSNQLSITTPAGDPTPANNAESKSLTVGMRKLYLPVILK